MELNSSIIVVDCLIARLKKLRKNTKKQFISLYSVSAECVHFTAISPSQLLYLSFSRAII